MQVDEEIGRGAWVLQNAECHATDGSDRTSSRDLGDPHGGWQVVWERPSIREVPRLEVAPPLHIAVQ
jgi:hypothetical protein